MLAHIPRSMGEKGAFASWSVQRRVVPVPSASRVRAQEQANPLTMKLCIVCRDAARYPNYGI
jgi:hypothetical protein